MNIERYVIVNEEGEAEDIFYETVEAARNAAIAKSHSTGEEYAVIARIFEYSDSELVYTTNGEDEWPS